MQALERCKENVPRGDLRLNFPHGCDSRVETPPALLSRCGFNPHAHLCAGLPQDSIRFTCLAFLLCISQQFDLSGRHMRLQPVVSI